MNISDDTINWLLESNPWTKYRTLIDFLGEAENSIIVHKAREELTDSPEVKNLVKDAGLWFPDVYTRHNDAKISHYKLRMLSDFGLTLNDPGIKGIINKAVKHTEDGLFAFKQELPQKGNGFSKPNPNSDEWHALPCDSPLITYTLLKLGYDSPELFYNVQKIKENWSDSKGWFCHFFFVESMYKKMQIGCPMAGLMALEVFSQIPGLKESDFAKNAFQPIQFHKDHGKSLYYFGRSKKFWTIKYPFVWYNALYLAEVLSRFDFLKKNELLKDIIEWIQSSSDSEGRFKPTSMFMNYKGWDFANKKEPSPWLTYLCLNILNRYYD